MNRSVLVALLAVSCAFSSQASLASSCAKYADQLGSSFNPQGCVCGNSLRNLEATPPNQLKIAAACNLRWPGGKTIDLTRQKTSLDRYTNGNLPFGHIFLLGEARLHGELRYEPGNAGDFWFSPRSLLVRQEKAWSPELRMLKFIGEDLMVKFRVPAGFRKIDCFTANATIVVNGLRVLIGETDEAGAYPIEYKVTSVTDFKGCSEK